MPTTTGQAMQAIKRPYSMAVQSLATLRPFRALLGDAGRRPPYGWRRWAASLFAITFGAQAVTEVITSIGTALL